eukprot:5065369-Alexandrium_andersonii.AAC.1
MACDFPGLAAPPLHLSNARCGAAAIGHALLAPLPTARTVNNIHIHDIDMHIFRRWRPPPAWTR